MKLTICEFDYVGDIHPIIFDNRDEFLDLYYYWIQTKNNLDKVYVCFNNFRDAEYEDEHQTILVSHQLDDVTDFVESHTEFMCKKTLDFSIFEFERYQDAFRYCIDLKEGL